MAVTQAQHDPTAVVGRRVIAYIVDALIGAAISSAVFFSVAEEVESLPEAAFQINVQFGDTIYFAEGGDAWLVVAAGLAYAVLVYVVLTGLAGVTPGKALTGIRVVSEDGSRPGLGRAFLRWILLIVDSFPYVIPMLVGFIVAMTSQGHRRVGDMAAKTYVVRRADAGQPVVLPGAGAAAATPSAWAQPAPAPTAAVAPSPEPETTAPEAAAPVEQAQAAQPQAATSAAEANQPQWDAARNAWIAWDPSTGQWLQHDTASGQWRPIT